MRLRIRFSHVVIWFVLLSVAVALLPLTSKDGPPAGRGPNESTAETKAPRIPSAAANSDWLDDTGLSVARRFTPPIHDQTSLQELRQAVSVRGPLALAVAKAEFERVRLRFRAPREEVSAAAGLLRQIGLLKLHEGQYPEAAAAFQRALELGRPGDLSTRERADHMALLGITALSRAEAPGGQSIAREAVERFTAYLEKWPDDLRVRWLLNLAYMMLSEYPDQVPPAYLIPLESVPPPGEVGRFENVAARAGLTTRGPNMAGAGAFDDFNGDGRPDLFIASLDAERGAALFINQGDGTFADRSSPAGLDDQVFAVNLAHADYDNDGALDVVLVRGGLGEGSFRMSLLRNRGDGTFEDATLAAGMGEPIAATAAAWGDYDNDGRLDLFVCGDGRAGTTGHGSGRADSRNHCRLYRNQGDGTFRDAATVAGVVNERSATAAAWGDYDDDGRLDLYVANADGPARLYHNRGDGTFEDVARALNVAGPGALGSCWFWDYDNDGRLDLFATELLARAVQPIEAALGLPTERPSHPRLYRNLGPSGFRDVSHELGLDRPVPVLGCNFGDIDGDGFLDLYLGVGWPARSGLFPNRMLRNEEGKSFHDVTMSSQTGDLGKGQCVSFADWDGDGDLDLFVQTGGAVPGDRSYNLLFSNPGHGRHWLKVRLVGKRTNRSALGARIKVDVQGAGGQPRSIFRTVGGGSNVGGNTLVQSFGLLDAAWVAELTVNWPASRTTQTFHDIEADRTIEITEGSDTLKVVRQEGPGARAR